MAESVSIVIVTYNRCEDLKECLSSIFNLKAKPLEVVVVDSKSTDSTKQLTECFPIEFVSINRRNRQSARNLGISIAQGDVVAFLDDDVVVCDEWLRKLKIPYTNSNVGGVGGRAIPYGSKKGSYIKTNKAEVGKVFNDGLVIGNFDFPSGNIVEVDSFIGCNMSFRRNLLLKVGGFDDNYLGTGYRDDTDLCMRIRRLGYKLLYQPKSLVWHKFRGKQVNDDWSYWYIRNHVYFYLKNIFAEHKRDFPFFLYRMFFPPKDYVLKSGIKVRIDPALIPIVFSGLTDGYKTWRIHKAKERLYRSSLKSGGNKK